MKNRAIEFYRFVMACIIFILHFTKYEEWGGRTVPFDGGYLAVDFFFILSGFLLMRGIQIGEEKNTHRLDSTPEKETVKFIVGKYKKLYPPYIIAIVLVYVLNVAIGEFDHPFVKLMKSVPEILAVQVFVRPSAICGYTWFVSAIFWAGGLAFYLIRKFNDLATNILFPFIFLFFLGWSHCVIGHVDIVAGNDIFYAPFFRAFSEIGIGASLAVAVPQVEKWISRLPVAAVGIIELLSFAFAVFIMWRYRRSYMDYVFIFDAILLIVLTFTMHGFWSRLLDNKLSGVLGGVSYYIYIFQGVLQSFGLRGQDFWILTLVHLLLLSVFGIILKKILGATKTMGV